MGGASELIQEVSSSVAGSLIKEDRRSFQLHEGPVSSL